MKSLSRGKLQIKKMLKINTEKYRDLFNIMKVYSPVIISGLLSGKKKEGIRIEGGGGG